MTGSRDVDAATTTRLDIIVFLLSVVLGVAAYSVLRFLHVPQWVVTSSLVGLMLLYAVGVASIPRLRVRLDQAGDNAYYLGLLFTLVSMAFALYAFGRHS